eukprot:7898510-Pyramimonas_sp.AAC.1
MEHPAQNARGEGAPSSWQLPVLTRLCTQPGVIFHRVDQCMFGRSTQRPAGLLAVHTPSMTR